MINSTELRREYEKWQKAHETRSSAVESAQRHVARVERNTPTYKAMRRKFRNRLRNRNRFIDAALRAEAGDDDYADLEDWIVTRQGEDYDALVHAAQPSNSDSE